MNQAVLVYTDVDKSAKVSDIGYDTGKFHAFLQIIDGLYSFGKLKLLYLLTWVAAWLFQLFHDVGQGGQSCCIGYIVVDVYA